MSGCAAMRSASSRGSRSRGRTEPRRQVAHAEVVEERRRGELRDAARRPPTTESSIRDGDRRGREGVRVHGRTRRGAARASSSTSTSGSRASRAARDDRLARRVALEQVPVRGRVERRDDVARERASPRAGAAAAPARAAPASAIASGERTVPRARDDVAAAVHEVFRRGEAVEHSPGRS